MKSKLAALLLSVLMLVPALTACSAPKAQASYHPGHWHDKTYLSAQADLMYTTPDGIKSVETMPAAQDVLALPADSKAGQLEMAVTGGKEDYILILSEDLSRSFPEKAPDKAQYAQALTDRLTAQGKLKAGDAGYVKFINQEFSKQVFTEIATGNEFWYLTRPMENETLVIVLGGKDSAAIEKLALPFDTYDATAAQLNPALPADAKQQKEVFYRGKWKENVYYNQSLKLSFPMPEGFAPIDSQELRTYAGGDAIAKEDNLTAVDGYEDISLYDTGIAKEDGTSFLILAQDLASNTETKTVTTRAYADILLTRLEASERNYADASITEQELAGENYVVLTVKGADDAFCQKYVLRRMGDHMMCMLLSSPKADGKELDAILATMTLWEKE